MFAHILGINLCYLQAQQDASSSADAAKSAKSQVTGLEERLSSVSSQLSAAKTEVDTIKIAAAKRLRELNDALADAQATSKQAKAGMEVRAVLTLLWHSSRGTTLHSNCNHQQQPGRLRHAQAAAQHRRFTWATHHSTICATSCAQTLIWIILA